MFDNTKRERMCPMISRYSKPEMAALWSEQNKFDTWVRVEAAVLAAKKHLNLIDVEIPPDLVKSIRVDEAAIEKLEETLKHDMLAFCTHTSEQLPEALRPHWHNGLTSYDVEDTALGLILTQSVEQLIDRLEKLQEVLKRRALEFKMTPMMGRTHGVHAEVISFGAKVANWYDELTRHHERLWELRAKVNFGKISGAVGMYTLPPAVELITCHELGLRPIIATQIVSRDIIKEYVDTLANIGGSIEKFATVLRTLQRTEIMEVQEYFSKEQRGSSAMPHKRNPISFENVSGLARVLKGYAVTAGLNQVSWDERDLANSSSERIILPDASILLDYMLARFTGAFDKMLVYPERMKANIHLTFGAIFSQDVQSELAKSSGLPREEAYGIVRDIVQRCWDTRQDFRAALEADPRVTLTAAQLDQCFDLTRKLASVDHIFRQVFGE